MKSVAAPFSTSGTYQLIRQAVVTGTPVAAIYRGYRRLLCPHRLGWNEQGEARVLCYQYGGESERGLAPSGSDANWRCIAVDGLTEVQLLADTWHSAANHSNRQTCVARADVDVEARFL